MTAVLAQQVLHRPGKWQTGNADSYIPEVSLDSMQTKERDSHHFSADRRVA
jgi:hypothetical protein